MDQFDLERVLAHWRRGLRQRRVFLDEDLDELEYHLRDHVEALVDAGLSEREAFRRAARQLGYHHELEAEYRKVRYGRSKRKRHLRLEIRLKTSMLFNYLKIALRTMRRHPGFTFINVTGLAVGLACCALILLYVRHELRYDAFHPNADRIFRPVLHLELNGVVYDEASLQFPAAPAFVQEYPEVEAAVRLYRDDAPLLAYAGKKYLEAGFLFADSTFFEVFGFPLVKGDPATVLDDPNAVVLTERAAVKYFGAADPVGQVLDFNGTHALTVTGVARDVPAYSHFRFDFVAPMSLQLGIWRSASGDQGRENKWYWNGAWTYLLLDDPAAAPALEAKFGAFIEKYFPDSYKPGAALPLQPLRSIHLRSHLGNELEANGNMAFVYIFSAIALLVLVIACINFGNLTTVQVMQRAREVGVRKALGAGRSQVNVQLLSEGMLLSLAALALAAVLAALLLPVFSTLVDAPLTFEGLSGWAGGLSIALLVCAVGLVPGLYPALYLSRLNPLATLRGQAARGRRRWSFRNLLVGMQFATSIVLMIGVGVIYQQVRYTQERGLGFEKEHVIVAEARPEVGRQYKAFREALLASPAVREVASTAYVPGKGADGFRFIPEGRSADDPLMIPLTAVNYEFADVMGLSMQEGRWFSRAFPSDAEEGFVVNQQALELLGWTDRPLGRQLQLLAPGTTEVWQTGRVIGVIRDYHFESLHNPLKPLVMAYVPSANYFVLKVDGQRAQEALDHLERTWAQFSPEWPVNAHFLDQDLQALYNKEQRLGEVVGYLTLLAVLIACLGLVGLGSFTAARRRKEICIRKVHGATVPRVVALLSQGYLKLLVASFVVAAPLAYYGMSRWLAGFAYHTAIRPGVFIAAGLAAVLMAGLSVGYQSVRAALSNPANVLRHE